MAVSSPGKITRLARLFHPDTGRAMIVALDHGLVGMLPGIENLLETLERVLRGKPDGVVISAGAMPHVADKIQGQTGIILTVDTFLTSSVPRTESIGGAHRLLASVEDALVLGADAIKVFLVGGQDELIGFADNVARLAETARACERLGVPLIVEPVLWGRRVEPAKKHDSTLVAHMCRVAFEIGADVLKIPYPGSSDALHKLTSLVPCPILVMGGAKVGPMEQTLTLARGVVAAGARGIVFGQKVWQSPDVSGTVQALCAAIHEESTEPEASREG